MNQSVYSILTGPFTDSVAIFKEESMIHHLTGTKLEHVLVEYGPFDPAMMVYEPIVDPDDGSEHVWIMQVGRKNEGFVMTIGEFLTAMTEIGAEETKCEVMRIFDSVT